MITKKLKICTGCGWRSDMPICGQYLSCCPDSHYVPFGEITDPYLLANARCDIPFESISEYMEGIIFSVSGCCGI